MTHVSIRALRKEFADFVAVDDVDIEVESGLFVALLGPSGCGKTTTLRCLAGLETPTSGEIVMDGVTVSAPERGIYLRPEKRRVGMVFQSYGLWPHMTVAGNVGYPLKLQRLSRAEIRRRVNELLAVVQLEHLAGRSAAALSGGQQQRVALARALANDSSLVLYDEPLSNLDARLRASTRDQIRAVHNRMGSTSILVTHDQEEALTLADKVIVMNHGKVEQVGTPEEVYTRPRTSFVARFVGVANILAGAVVESREGTATVAVGDDGVRLEVRGEHPVGSVLEIAFRGEHARVGDVHEGEPNVLRGRVDRAVYSGQSVDLHLEAGGVPMRVSVMDGPGPRFQPPSPGTSIGFAVPAEAIRVLNAG